MRVTFGAFGGVRAGIMARIVLAENGCWQWTGFKKDGYGMVSIGRTSTVVHRVVYFLLTTRRPTPGKQLDHLCRNRSCCNPAHLEEVTPLVNSLRSTAGQRAFVRAMSATHCKNGHELKPENVVVYTYGKSTFRRCRLCPAPLRAKACAVCSARFRPTHSLVKTCSKECRRVLQMAKATVPVGEVARLRATGLSQRRIADALGIGQSSVSRALRKGQS